MKFAVALAVHFATTVSAIAAAPVVVETHAPVIAVRSPASSPDMTGYYAVCRICDDGMVVTIPDTILDLFGDPLSCKEWQLAGLARSVDPSDCEYLRFFTTQADVCGCAIDNTVCTLCENGGGDFIPNRLNFLFEKNSRFPGKTCADIAVSTKGNEFLNSVSGFSQCQEMQATIGEYCGCSNPTARSNLKCPMCGKNTPLPDPTRRVGSRQETCASIEYNRNRPTLGINWCHYDEYEQEYCCAPEPYTCLFTPCENGASPLYPNAEVGLLGLTCGNVQGFIQDTALLQGDANCELLRIPGLKNCGCPPCTLCEDGTASFDPSRKRGEGLLTCAQEAENHATDKPPTCSLVQATIGEQCGCNNPIANAKIGCQLCGPGTTLPDPTRMVNKWTSCADMEYRHKEICYVAGPVSSSYEADFCCAATFESSAPVTSTPVTNPGYPPCQVCGAGKIVTIPDGTVSPPGLDSLSCKAFQIQGLTGYIDPEGCPIAYVFMSECGCAKGNLFPATPAPVTTNAPVTAAPTAVKKYPKGFCFSGETTVAVKRKGSILMRHLQIGDEVLTTSGNYEQVYSFGHRLETIEAEFLQLLPSGLEISRDHMVLVKGRFVPASLVQVGDMLESAGGNFVTVDSIERVIRNGVYAPFTTSGTIVVNNIKASTYVAFHNTDRLHIGSWESPLTFQWVAHVSQSPHRLFTRLGWTGGAEQYTVDGKSLWIAGPHDFAEWLLEQNGMVVGAVLVPTLGLGLMSMAMEGLVSWFDSSS